MKAEITLAANGTGSLALDGVDVSNGCTGFSLDYSVHSGHTRPLLRLDLTILEGLRVSLEDPDVYISPQAADLLIRLGWTPPTTDPAPTSVGAVRSPSASG